MAKVLFPLGPLTVQLPMLLPEIDVSRMVTAVLVIVKAWTLAVPLTAMVLVPAPP